MITKVRATMHNGRASGGKAYSAKHNDRSFDTVKARHINSVPERKNLYFVVGIDGTVDNHPEVNFETHEKRVYEALFSESLKKQTERHIKAGHANRVRTMDEYRTAIRTCPEETILQLGTREKYADPQAFIKAVNIWCQQIQAIYGSNLRLTCGSMHFDESTPHCHIRAVWTATGKDGLEVSQTKALKELGIQRPDPTQPEGKHNNAKITFTQQSREIWIAAARECGIEIETVPETPGKTTLTKEEFVAKKIRKEIVELVEKRDDLRAEASQAASERASIRSEVADLKQQKSRLEAAVGLIKEWIRPVKKLFEKLAAYRISDTRTVLDDILLDANTAPAYEAIRELDCRV